MNNEEKILEILGELSSKFNKLETNQNNMLESQDKILKTQDKIQGELTSLKSQVSENTQLLKSLEHKSAHIQGEITTIKNTTEKIDSTTSSMKTDFELVKIVTVANSKDIAQLRIVK